MGQLAVEMTGDEKQLLRSLERTIRAQDNMLQKLQKVQKEGQRAGRSHRDAFGAGAVQDLRAYATGLLTVSAATGAISRFMADIVEKERELAQGLRTREEGMKRLAQVSTSKGEFAQLENLAKQIGVTEGLDVGAAAELVFQAKSQGLLADVKLLAQTQRYTDAQAMIEAVGKFTSAFGAQEAGTTPQLLSKFLQAAADSDVAVEEIARAAVIAAQGATRVGATDEELLGLMSVLSPAFKSPETAAQRLQALTSVLAKGYERETGRMVRDDSGRYVREKEQVAFTQRGILAGLEEFKKAAPEEFAKAMLGREEAAAAWQAIMTNRAALQPRIAQVTAAGVTQAPLQQQLQITREGVLEMLRQERRGKVSESVALEERGAAALRYDVAMESLVEGYLKKGDVAAMLEMAVMRSLLNAARYTFWGPGHAANMAERIRAQSLGGQAGPEATSRDLVQEQNQLLRQIAENTGKARGSYRQSTEDIK